MKWIQCRSINVDGELECTQVPDDAMNMIEHVILHMVLRVNILVNSSGLWMKSDSINNVALRWMICVSFTFP